MHHLSLTVVLVLLLGPWTPPPIATAQADERCFPETGQCLDSRFRAYWERNGGLEVFGFPLSPVGDETPPAQWFERNRLEHHPANAAPYDVLLARLGAQGLERRGVVWQRLPRPGPQPGCRYFEETTKNVCDQDAGQGFKTYWQTHGLRDPALDAYQQSLALFGLPLTEARLETNPDGEPVLMQWFERARFEWHPAKPPAFRVLLGLLGRESRPVARPAPAVIGAIPLDVQPLRMAVNPATGRLYVTSFLGPPVVTVIDGRSATVVGAIAPRARGREVMVDPTADRIFVIDDTIWSVDPIPVVSVIDGATNAEVATVRTEGSIVKAALNPATGRVYLLMGAPRILVIDGPAGPPPAGGASVVATLPMPATDIAINPVTNRAYLVSGSSDRGSTKTTITLSVVDLATHAVVATVPIRELTFTSPPLLPGLTALYGYSVVVNPATNRVYVSDSGTSLFPEEGEPHQPGTSVLVIDGVTNTRVGAVSVGKGPRALVVDPAVNHVYVFCDGDDPWRGPGMLWKIDGATNTATPVDRRPGSVPLVSVTATSLVVIDPRGTAAADSVTFRVYHTRGRERSVSIIQY